MEVSGPRVEPPDPPRPRRDRLRHVRRQALKRHPWSETLTPGWIGPDMTLPVRERILPALLCPGRHEHLVAVEAFLLGALVPSPHDHDVLAQALNERFSELAAIVPSPTPAISRFEAVGNENSDAALIVGIERGHQEALAEAHRRHGPSVYGLASRMCEGGETGDAEDVTHDVFLALWRAPERYNPERGSLRSHLLTRAYKEASRRVRIDRSRGLRPRSGPASAPRGPAPAHRRRGVGVVGPPSRSQAAGHRLRLLRRAHLRRSRASYSNSRAARSRFISRTA